MQAKDKKKVEQLPVDPNSDNHQYQVMDTVFDIPKRYEVVDILGHGAYGIVVAARDQEVPKGASGEDNLVAIKKIVKAFEHRVFSLRTYRELKIQRLLEHENILGIKRLLQPKDRKSFSEIYVVFDLMEADLSKIIKS